MKTSIVFHGHAMTIAQPGDETTPVTVILGGNGNIYADGKAGWSGDFHRAVHSLRLHSYVRTDAAGLRVLIETGHL